MNIKQALLILLMSPLISFAQETKGDEMVFDAYVIQLELKENQKIQFKSILNAYKEKLEDSSIEASAFNKLNKLRALEIYNILDKTQFELFNKIKLKVEPKLKYRFE